MTLFPLHPSGVVFLALLNAALAVEAPLLPKCDLSPSSFLDSIDEARSELGLGESLYVHSPGEFTALEAVDALNHLPASERLGLVFTQMAMNEQHLAWTTSTMVESLLARGKKSVAGRVSVSKAEIVSLSDERIAIKGSEGMLGGRKIEFPEMALSQTTPKAGASALLERAIGTKAKPLYDGDQQVRGGFQSIFECAPPRDCLYKVFDPMLERRRLKQSLGRDPTPEEVAARMLPEMQRDAAVHDFLADLLKNSEGPPPFRLVRRKQLAPGVTEVERVRDKTLTELRMDRSPLLKKCAKSLEKLERAMSLIYFELLVAQEQRYGHRLSLEMHNGEYEAIPIAMGPDVNPSHIALGGDCVPVLMDW